MLTSMSSKRICHVFPLRRILLLSRWFKTKSHSFSSTTPPHERQLPNANTNVALITLAGCLAWIASGANLHSTKRQTGQTGIDPPVIFPPPSSYYLRDTFVEPATLPRCCPFSAVGLCESHSPSLQRLEVFLSSLTAVISPPFHRSPLPSSPTFHTRWLAQRPGCSGKIRAWCCFHGTSDTTRSSSVTDRFSTELYLMYLFYIFYKTDFELTYKYLAFGHDGMITLQTTD